MSKTSPKLRSSSDVKNMDIVELKKLIKEHTGITFPVGSTETDIRGFAKNQLHGIIFIEDNEEIVKGKIIKQTGAKQ